MSKNSTNMMNKVVGILRSGAVLLKARRMITDSVLGA